VNSGHPKKTLGHPQSQVTQREPRLEVAEKACSGALNLISGTRNFQKCTNEMYVDYRTEDFEVKY
jgi:hypothetical protein